MSHYSEDDSDLSIGLSDVYEYSVPEPVQNTVPEHDPQFHEVNEEVDYDDDSFNLDLTDDTLDDETNTYNNDNEYDVDYEEFELDDNVDDEYNHSSPLNHTDFPHNQITEQLHTYNDEESDIEIVLNDSVVRFNDVLDVKNFVQTTHEVNLANEGDDISYHYDSEMYMYEGELYYENDVVYFTSEGEAYYDSYYSHYEGEIGYSEHQDMMEYTADYEDEGGNGVTMHFGNSDTHELDDEFDIDLSLNTTATDDEHSLIEPYYVSETLSTEVVNITLTDDESLLDISLSSTLTQSTTKSTITLPNDVSLPNDVTLPNDSASPFESKFHSDVDSEIPHYTHDHSDNYTHTPDSHQPVGILNMSDELSLSNSELSNVDHDFPDDVDVLAVDDVGVDVVDGVDSVDDINDSYESDFELDLDDIDSDPVETQISQQILLEVDPDPIEMDDLIYEDTVEVNDDVPVLEDDVHVDGDDIVYEDDTHTDDIVHENDIHVDYDVQDDICVDDDDEVHEDDIYINDDVIHVDDGVREDDMYLGDDNIDEVYEDDIYLDDDVQEDEVQQDEVEVNVIDHDVHVITDTDDAVDMNSSIPVDNNSANNVDTNHVVETVEGSVDFADTKNQVSVSDSSISSISPEHVSPLIHTSPQIMSSSQHTSPPNHTPNPHTPTPPVHIQVRPPNRSTIPTVPSLPSSFVSSLLPHRQYLQSLPSTGYTVRLHKDTNTQFTNEVWEGVLKVKMPRPVTYRSEMAL